MCKNAMILIIALASEEPSKTSAGAGRAFVIRGGPNSENFLSNLRKLLKRGKFFLTTQSLIVKRN